MKHYDDDDILKYYWENNDNQDGTFFNSYEKSFQINDDFDDTFDVELEEKKWRAVLYLRLHKELLKNKSYKKVYNYIIDEYIRISKYEADALYIVDLITDWTS